MTEDGNIHKLQVRRKPDLNTKPPLQAVKYGRCKHNNIEVDETLMEVTCTDCRERLNPMSVLVRLATEDDSLYWRRESLRKEVASYQDRLKFKCGSCGQVNNITKPLRTRTI